MVFLPSDPCLLRDSVGSGSVYAPPSKSEIRDSDALDPEEGEIDEENRSEEIAEGVGGLFQKHRAVVLGIALCLLLLVPFAYRPGGEIQVLPPIQQEIQAPISGRITEVQV